ncbi:MAG: phospholipase D family protein [Aromatoleum sp.]|jgi:phosphatidylserine/phosphatidylglycerophosphate/cardiolipin synthase-like enzyme|uniref:phospholipase D family nuclease n=1 Tax=Aromatoleum sp. TaxID=2307007 RepID=UPI002894F25D|nr:phospholipase D family protein [Aromatoleum sp.]MDT3669537.1 phospholipase D family protein [Aromatoleum sp.]
MRKGPRSLALAVLVVVSTLAGSGLRASETLNARGSVEIAFSPAGDPEAALLRVIDRAREALHVQAYVFTSRPIAKALIAAHRRGVQVEVLADADMNRRGKGNAIPQLLEAGIPVAFETRYAAAHNKVLIADAEGRGCAVATGSFNFTWSANHRNAENLLILRDNCPLAKAYLDNWQRHRADAAPVTRLPWKP